MAILSLDFIKFLVNGNSHLVFLLLILFTRLCFPGLQEPANILIIVSGELIVKIYFEIEPSAIQF